MDFERIAASAPINRTAAMVASGTTSDEPLTTQQKRENLVGLVKQIDKAIQITSDPIRKKYLGHSKLDIQNALSKLPRVIPKGNRDLSKWIVDVTKERISRALFRLILEEAQRRYDTANMERANERVSEHLLPADGSA